MPLGLRILRKGWVVPALWCERAGMPTGTTLDQLDGTTVVPERPDQLEKYVQGQALGPSAAVAPLVPLEQWPLGVSVVSLLSPALAKRLAATGIDLDPSNLIRITIGELLILPKMGVASVIQLGREIEAGVARRGASSHPLAESAWVADDSESALGSPASASTDRASDEDFISSSGTSVPAQVRARFGVDVACSHQRFTEPGWSYQGVCDLICGDCDQDAPFVIYRKPYETSRGSYRYWAIVCLTCKTASSLKDFDTADHAAFRRWDTSVSVAELVPAPEESPREPNPGHLDPPERPQQAISGASPMAVPREVDINAPDLGVPAADTTGPPEEPAAHPTMTVDPTVIAAAQAEFDASSDEARMVDIGPIRRDDVGEPNVFRVSAPSMDLADLPPAEIYLAVPPGEGERYAVQIKHASVTEAVVTSAEGVPHGLKLHLYVVIDPSHVAKAFVEYLKTCTSAHLAPVLSNGGPLYSARPEEIAGLNAPQQLAAGAITSPGVSVIWGPPGTGKTRVIGEAVALLLRRGMTVAVVSNTNVAVDQAVLHVDRVAGPIEAGEILRVGNPSIPEVTDHPSLTLSKAVQAKNRNLLEELDRLQVDLSAARSELDQLNAERLDHRLAGFTPQAIEDLAARSAQLARREDLERLIGAGTSQLQELRAHWTNCGRQYDAARERLAGLADSIGLLEDEREVASLNKQIEQGDELLGQLERRTQEVLGERLLKRRRLLKELAEVRGQTERSTSACIDRRARHLDRLAEAELHGITPVTIRTAQAAEASAETAWREAKKRVLSTETILRDLQSEALALGSIAPLTETELDVVTLIDERGGPKPLIDAAHEHRARARSLEQRVKDLLAKIERIQAELQKQEETVLAGAKVVGTTLAQLVLHRGLVTRTFDHVIVDEASAALPPYVYAAMTKAQIGCTLVGDFEQNGPITRCSDTSLPPPLRPWLLADPFERVGIRSAAEATASEGCVVLRDQYRFGDRTMELANKIAYGGLLRHGRTPDDFPGIGPEMVVIDTSDLKDAARAETDRSAPGRWWAVGAALSYELARRHAFEGIGVVTPYRRQAQLTRALAHNGDAAAAVQIGTAHQFQGREFPVVIVDLVEDGTGTSWVAKANRRSSSWSRTGVRIFNVAVTRNAGRVYIITNAGAVKAARSGPLSDLKGLLGSDGVQIWNAREVLDGSESVVAAARSMGSVLNEPPRLLDDEEFYAAFLNDALNARERVVVFSPFLAEARLVEVLPVLEDLVTRGVPVTVLTKSASELWSPGLLDELRSRGVVVRERKGMHEKVVIIDRHVTYIGSLNALSNTGKTGEVMLRMQGTAATERIAQWMNAAARTSNRRR